LVELETWVTIPDFPDYKVSDRGNILNINSGRILKPGLYTYKKVYLYKKGRPYMRYVHRLVAQSFIPNPEGKKEVNHKDFDKHNNHVSNLEWVSYSENNAHAIERVRGSMKGLACKLKESDVISIRRLLDEGVLLQKEIAALYGVTGTTVGDIKQRRSWSWL